MILNAYCPVLECVLSPKKKVIWDNAETILETCVTSWILHCKIEGMKLSGKHLSNILSGIRYDLVVINMLVLFEFNFLVAFDGR